MALAAPLARRVFISLGLSVVTFAGLSVAVNSMLSTAKAAWAGGGIGAGAQLIAMAGINTALSIIVGAIIGRVAMIALKRIQPS